MTSLVNILRTNKLPFGLQECADFAKEHDAIHAASKNKCTRL